MSIEYRQRWRGRARFVIFDSGGDPHASTRAFQAWRADPERPARLHYIVLSDGPLAGYRRVPQADARTTLDLLNMAPQAALAQLEALIDHAILDGARLPGDACARALARCAAPGTSISSKALGPAQQAALAACGFRFDGANAVYDSRKPARVRSGQAERRALVIGAGLAGAAACERLCARGWQVTLVERHAAPAQEASGNLAGIFMPLVSIDDNLPTRLTRAAYLYALDYFELLGGIGAAIEGGACGVMQLARDARHGAVQQRIARAHGLPPGYAEWFDGAAAAAMLGAPAPDGAWLFRQGGWARPGSVVAAMLGACGARLERRFGVGSVALRRAGRSWQALDAAGALVAEAPVAVLAGGAAAASFEQARTLPLQALRGQVTHLGAGSVPALPFVLCREAYLTPAAHGLWCAGASYDADPDPSLREDSQRENLAKLAALLGAAPLAQAPLAGRVGFRSVAPDRLPLVGALPDAAAAGSGPLRALARHPGLYGLLGLASRGLIWAPLAAELLAARLDGEPLPLEAQLAAALDPARFVLRARRAPRQ
ncbi:MAG: FAD-dependent 5-carboxymethylaminomethyl-2-thiouridine(34) oxidoreductase MnmC [Pseudomonadota bacterium]